MASKQGGYLSYLLRLWQERDRLPTVWRASLEDSHTGERRGFADIVQLFAFIEEQVSEELEEPTKQVPPVVEPMPAEEIRATQAPEE